MEVDDLLRRLQQRHTAGDAAQMGGEGPPPPAPHDDSGRLVQTTPPAESSALVPLAVSPMSPAEGLPPTELGRRGSDTQQASWGDVQRGLASSHGDLLLLMHRGHGGQGGMTPVAAAVTPQRPAPLLDSTAPSAVPQVVQASLAATPQRPPYAGLVHSAYAHAVPSGGEQGSGEPAGEEAPNPPEMFPALRAFCLAAAP